MAKLIAVPPVLPAEILFPSSYQCPISEIHRIVSQKQLPAGEGSASDRPGDGGMVITPTQGDNTGGAGGAKQKCCNV